MFEVKEAENWEFRTVVLNREQFCPPTRDIWQYLETYYAVPTEAANGKRQVYIGTLHSSPNSPANGGGMEAMRVGIIIAGAQHALLIC